MSLSKHVPQKSLLIVEDDPLIQQGLLDLFVYHGYRVEAASTGTIGLQKASSQRFDMILLDVMLPEIDGFEVCRQIRTLDRKQAIIMLTARDGENDILKALSQGADDYITKPFSIQILKARVEAILRRADIASPRHSFLIGDIEIHPATFEGKKNSTTLEFSKREMDLLVYLYQHADKIVSREELLEEVWGYRNTSQLDTRTVDIHITKLRKTIEVDAAKPKIILTLRGEGYRLVKPSP